MWDWISKANIGNSSFPSKSKYTSNILEMVNVISLNHSWWTCLACCYHIEPSIWLLKLTRRALPDVSEIQLRKNQLTDLSQHSFTKKLLNENKSFNPQHDLIQQPNGCKLTTIPTQPCYLRLFNMWCNVLTIPYSQINVTWRSWWTSMVWLQEATCRREKLSSVKN